MVMLGFHLSQIVRSLASHQEMLGSVSPLPCGRVRHNAVSCVSTRQSSVLQVGANRWEYDYAKIQGSFRKLDVPESSQYDEEAYSEALTESLEATKRFVMHTT